MKRTARSFVSGQASRGEGGFPPSLGFRGLCALVKAGGENYAPAVRQEDTRAFTHTHIQKIWGGGGLCVYFSGRKRIGIESGGGGAGSRKTPRTLESAPRRNPFGPKLNLALDRQSRKRRNKISRPRCPEEPGCTAPVSDSKRQPSPPERSGNVGLSSATSRELAAFLRAVASEGRLSRGTIGGPKQEGRGAKGCAFSLLPQRARAALLTCSWRPPPGLSAAGS